MTTNGQSPEQWLQCHLDRGMFSDEIAVTYPAEGTVLRSVFVPVSEVQGQPGAKGAVRVKVLRKGGSVYAILPTTESDAVVVKERDLSGQP